MTKLMEWLFAVGTLGTIWLALITNTIENSFVRDHYTLLLLSPVILVGLFGLGSLALVLYRVYTFNNCDEAAVDLQKEIIEAKEDLKRLGFKFKD
ncbi:dolichol-phosphate mannosyltransferase subunit 3 [Anthonomus grandis grandis]|uniref:dolichol-phosphate mannosyltransferase subunit 3 n=1 Tax=Anthonomus grandis grandis TaxID=2921223 RepID=UPI002165CD00|nr:dolichol-phosphate mannosyltransferase subunit 3 [Anthonomus grandis grandis]